MAKGANNVSKKRLGSSKPYDVSNEKKIGTNSLPETFGYADALQHIQMSQSFVKQVADRVSNLLPQTSWLNRWLLPASSNAEDTSFLPSSNSEEDNITDQPPPSKRARIPLHQSFSPESFQVSKPSLRNEPDDREEAGPSGLSSFPRSRLASSTPATHSVPTHSHADLLSPITNGDDRSDSGESTSGCSSLVPQGTRQSFNNDTSDRSMNVKRASVDERDFSTYLQSSRIFPNRTTPSLCLNSSNSRQGPSFNASLYTLPFSTRSPSIDKSFTSPFYPGPTAYGGASAIRKPRNGFFSPSEILPVTQSIQVKPINRSDSSELSSVTARRILDTLDELSSPVRDAKRVPLMTPSTRKRKAETTMSGSPGPPTQDLTIPTVPDLLKLHRRMKLQDSLESARLIASSSGGTQSAVSSEYQLKLQKEASRHTGKITSRTMGLDDSPPQDVQLPNIALPISSLPKFDFLLPEGPKQGFHLNRAADISLCRNKSPPDVDAIDKLKTNTSSSKKHLTLTNVPGTQAPVVSSINFIPSCPSKVNAPFSQTRLKEKPKKVMSSEGNGPVENAGFGISIAGELKTGSVMDILSKPNSTSQPSESTPKSGSDSWECNTCLIRNKVEVSQCRSCKTPRSIFKVPLSSTKPHTTPSQSVITKRKAPVVTSKFSPQSKPPIGTWVCDSCLVQNKPEAAVCISCAGAKPSLKLAHKVEVPAVGFDKKFLPASDTWECVTCMVRNKITLEYCAACESKKPGTVNSLSVAKPASGFGDKFKKPEGSWDCTDCLVLNKEVLKCVACGASKPDTAKTSIDNAFTSKAVAGVSVITSNATAGFSALTSKATSGFSTITSNATSGSSTITSTATSESSAAPSMATSGFGDMFKLPEGSWECPDCLLVNKDGWKCVACEATKPGIPGFGDMFKPPEGSWECPVCMVSNKNTSKCVACEAPKPGTEKSATPTATIKFNFNVPPEASSFKFGVDKAGDTSVVDTAAANKPIPANFKFGASTPSMGTTGFTFGSPVTTTSTTNASGFSFGSGNSLSKITPVSETTPALFSFGIPPPEKKVSTEQTEKVVCSKTESNATVNKNNVDSVPLNKVAAHSTFAFGSNKSDEPAKPKATVADFKFGPPASTPSSVETSSVKLNGPSTPSTIVATTAAISMSSTTPSFGTVTTSNVPVTSQSLFGTSKPSPLFGGFSSSQLPAFGQPPAGSTTSSVSTFSVQSKSTVAFSFVPPAAVGQKRSCNDDDDDRIPGGKKQAPEFSPLAGKISSNIFGSVASTTNATIANSAPSFGSLIKTPGADFKSSVTPTFGTSFSSKTTEIGSEKPALSKSSTPFVFGANTSSGGASTGLSFPTKQENPVPAPSNVFSFGSSAPPSSAGFSFSGQAAEKPTAGFSFGSTPASFGNVPAAAPVFGSASTAHPTPSAGFNFGASTQQVPTSNMFSFSAPAPAPVFAFGQNAAPAPTFDPNARPSFNFTGGEIPQFTAAGASVQPSPTARRIKKAVRRTPR